MPGPGSGKGEERETGPRTQGKKKPSIKGRTEFVQMIHNLLVRQCEISGVIYGGKGAVKDFIRQVDLHGGYDLCGKQPRKEGRGRIADRSQSGSRQKVVVTVLIPIDR